MTYDKDSRLNIVNKARGVITMWIPDSFQGSWIEVEATGADENQRWPL
ncbi:phosphate ABC transporter permease [Xenorhabdus mauleonii]|uniref:Phosphate ABC transporter permease n=1 Tax=Xenorhabdus mauleonii TaxID=351675 RepID=A0A1I3TJ03_9GAMM|nr:hypothetical protein [Xenorhabdus mauleonii]PHM39738.1 phosphate ABC transporter permease [Xenorhabdus mauleonii]SFJ70389.1 hypothetical protein SAMN05421680_11430 [Xenorhabdus mauleonii]